VFGDRRVELQRQILYFKITSTPCRAVFKCIWLMRVFKQLFTLGGARVCRAILAKLENQALTLFQR
jgi:hypothetical protein